MRTTKIWLSSPHMGGGELKYIQQAFDANLIAPLGHNVESFEIDMDNCVRYDVHVSRLNAGTVTLYLGLILLGVKARNEVICQSMTCSASTNPIVYFGATTIFVDSEDSTWNICPEKLEIAIKDRISKGKKPKAIVAVHLYGMPYQHDEIRRIADRYERSEERREGKHRRLR